MNSLKAGLWHSLNVKHCAVFMHLQHGTKENPSTFHGVMLETIIYNVTEKPMKQQVEGRDQGFGSRAVLF